MTVSLKKQPVYWVLRGISSLPLPILYILARFFTFCAWHGKSQLRRITELNLQYCFPNMANDERETLAKASVLETMNVAVEMPLTLFRPPEESLARIDSVVGGELIESFVAKGYGVIVLAPHLGNWEYLGLYLVERFNCAFMYKPVANETVNTLIKRARTQTGATLMPTNKQGVMGLLKHLKKGGISGILPDQVPDDAASRVVAPFYGQAAQTMSLVSSFAKKPNIKVVAAFSKRLPNKQFELVFEPVDDDLYSKDVEISAAAVNKAVEKLIEQAPAQYQWEYKRFKYDEHGRKHQLYKKAK